MKTRQTLDNQIHTNLMEKIAFGDSKHSDKQNLKFGESTYKIYSYSTYKTYLKECLAYSRWLVEEKGFHKKTDYRETEALAAEYIQSRMDAGVSVYTVKMERSALSMLYSKPVDVKLPQRNNKGIVRSREATANDKHICRTGKYKDVFDVCLATGGRRCDISKLTVNDFREIDGHMYVFFQQSKGGRNRLAPVREEYTKRVKEILENAKNNEKKRLFGHIPKEIDIHALRREYAKNLYNDIIKYPELKKDYLKHYPERHEYKTQKDSNGNSYKKEIKKNTYTDRDKNIYERDDIYIISQALGHSRLEVSVTHYLK